MHQTHLLKSESVLPLVLEGEQNVVFRQDESEAGPVVVRLDREIFVDMGSPTVVTVTVVPGDELNK